MTVAELDTFRPKLPNRISGIRLGRLAVNLRYQRKGLEELLLVDALTGARRVQQDASVAGLFVDSLDEQAAGLNLHLGFSPSPGNPFLLF